MEYIWQIIVGLVVAAIAGIFKQDFFRKKSKSKPATSESVSVPIEIHKEKLEEAVKRKELEMQVAHGKENIFRLQKQVIELYDRLTDPQKSLEEKNARIASLELALEREGNDIGAEKLEEAKIALENNDFSKADELFSEIETHEELAVQRSARAAFARGEIAEQEIRWEDAAKHYARSAQLDPNFNTLIKAETFAYAVGDYHTALSFNTRLKKEAIAKYGKESEEYAKAINNHASIYTQQGKYEQAKPLHKEALKLRQNILNTKNPDVLKGKDPDITESLNNLASCYILQEKYNKAEPLLKQALNICKETFGYNNPNTATCLNNLGFLYYKKGERTKAESYCKQALEIFESTLGPNHPTIKSTKESYKYLKKSIEDNQEYPVHITYLS